VSNTKKVLIRHRGDGRAITRTVEDFDEPMKSSLFIDLETRIMAGYGGKLTQNMVQSAARQYGKAAALGMMYGMGAARVSFQQQKMFQDNGGVSARNPKNGPFRVVEYGGSQRNRKKRYSHKVINKNGYRVHRSGEQSCNAVCERLNIEYAKYLMLKPDERDDQTMFGGNSAVNWKAP
jgi:hypothetical protein